MLKHARQLDVVRDLNEGFSCSQCLERTALDDMLVMEYEEITELFLVHAPNACIRHKIAVFYARPSYQPALLLLHQALKEYGFHERELE